MGNISSGQVLTITICTVSTEQVSCGISFHVKLPGSLVPLPYNELRRGELFLVGLAFIVAVAYSIKCLAIRPPGLQATGNVSKSQQAISEIALFSVM